MMNQHTLKQRPPHTDQDLFRRIAAGEAAAFTELFDRYFDTLRSNAFKLLKSEFWVEEIVQEVFLQLWEGRAKLSDVEAPLAYLYRLTANHCLKRLRREELEARTQYLVRVALHGTTDTTAENRYDGQRIEQLIHRAVEQLPEQQRAVFRLQQEEGLSYQAIAERLDISKNTVRNHQVRALHAIRTYLQQHGALFGLLFSVWYLFKK